MSLLPTAYFVLWVTLLSFNKRQADIRIGLSSINSKLFSFVVLLTSLESYKICKMEIWKNKNHWNRFPNDNLTGSLICCQYTWLSTNYEFPAWLLYISSRFGHWISTFTIHTCTCKYFPDGLYVDIMTNMQAFTHTIMIDNAIR